MTASKTKVAEWSTRFRKVPLARRVVTGLNRRSGEIWKRTFDLLQHDSPEYRNSVDEEFTRESKSHCRELLNSIIAVAAGRAGRSDPFGFVRTHAEWRARRQVPLIASLHAYRLAHKTYWGITREALQGQDREEALAALTMLSDFWMEFFDHVGAVLAESHAAEETLSVAQNARAYARLIDELLRGIEPKDAEARRLSTLCGIRPDAPVAVAVARPFPSGNGNHIDREVTLRSLARLLQQQLSAVVFGKLVDVRNDEVTAIVCSDSDTGRRLLKALRDGFGPRSRNGQRVGVGVSLDTTEISRLGKALDEARHALDFAVPSKPLLHFADIDLSEFLIRRADPAARRLVPEPTLRLVQGGDDPSRELSRTIRTFADCSLNVKETARRLGVHANTVYFRLNRIQKLTGIDPRTFSGASLLMTSLRLLDIDG